VTDRSIARELGLGPDGYANVATQRRRILAKLECFRATQMLKIERQRPPPEG
jgi:hypothetical protein